MNGNITVAALNGKTSCKTAPLYQYDYGQVLQITGVDLPQAYEVHFGNAPRGESTTQIGNADGVIIPDAYLTSGSPIYAWIYLHAGNDDGETEYVITIPVNKRAAITNQEPTPVQQDAITEAIAALNDAVEQTAQDVIDTNAAKEAAEAARDEITGMSATATTLAPGSSATASYANGVLSLGIPRGDQGEKGDTGDTGATPDFTIGTVSTLPAGSSATASIIGTAEDPVLNLGIPKGDTGEVTQAEFDALSDTVDDMQDTLEHKADIDGYYSDMTVGAAEQVVSSTMYEDTAPYKFRTSGGSADIGNRAYVDKIVGGTIAWNQQVRDAASENSTDFADIVTVTDAVEDDAAVSVRVEPVQDLHGYDSPWPAGGGKNLFNWDRAIGTPNPSDGEASTSPRVMDTEHYYVGLTRNNYYIPRNITQYSVSNGTISLTMTSGGFGIGFPVKVEPSTVYTVSYSNATNAKISEGFYDADWNFLSHIDGGVTFTTPANAAYVTLVVTPANVGECSLSNIQLEQGSTATSFAPYSNLCPISGWDEVKVTRTGKNLLNPDFNAWVDGTVYKGFKYADEPIEVTLSISDNDTSVDIGASYLGLSLYNSSVGGTVRWLVQSGTALNTSLTLSDKCYVSIYPKTEDTFNRLFARYNIQLKFGSTATAYEPYQGNTYTIEMPTEAGTVYGGELTVNEDGSGSLVVDRAEVDLGSLNYARYDATQTNLPVFYTGVNDLKPMSGNQCESSAYKCKYWSSLGTRTDYTIEVHPTLSYIYIADSRYETAADFKSAVSGVQFVYPLSTPTTYALTATQVQTLLGTNHVWSDAGQIALTYTGTDEHLVLTTGRKYLTRINGTDSMVLGAGQEVTAVKGRDNVFDLTQMLGTSVADYVYQQGAGYFRRWFGGSHYAYNAGELLSVEGLQSHDTVGFNAFDADTVFDGASGITKAGNEYVATASRFAQFTGVNGWEKTAYVNGMSYYGMAKFRVNANVTWMRVEWRYTDGTFTYGTKVNAGETGVSYALSDSSKTIERFILTYGSNGNNQCGVSEVCINLSHNASRNGEYQPYEKHSYPLDSTLTLRGIPKVDSNGVYWDGDEYGYDGAVKRRYARLVFDGSNDETWTLQSINQHGIANFYYTIVPYKTVGTPNGICNMFTQQTTSIASTTTEGWLLAAGTYLYIRVSADKASTGSQFKTWLSNNNLQFDYELATPTAETAAPYQHIQSVDDWGTEEFVSSTITHVGHATRYPANLRDKLQHLPALASSNGSYLITQTNGQMVLSPFPTPPTTAGNYLLKATVSGGNATYSWVAQ